MGIQGVTGGYKGLPGVPRGLQGITRGNKALQGVQRIIEYFLLTRTFPDTFFGLFCIKIKVEEISKF